MADPQTNKGIPIDWHVPEDVASQYANNMVVQHMDNEFVLSFFETFPPIIVGSSEDIKGKVDEVKDVRAKCVARIIIPQNKMKSLIQALDANLDRFLSEKGLGKEE
ncbi:MAG: DUF3467 domain-containing protein [Desulfobacterales bacterium]|nr:DUF3467 domain-containing protein [Desulfobacterales bacterium]